MTLSFSICLAVTACCLLAQDSKDISKQNNEFGSVSGVVLESITGDPVSGAVLSTSTNVRIINGLAVMGKETQERTTVTDQTGSYRLEQLPIGEYRVSARTPPPDVRVLSKSITIRSANEVSDIAFRFASNGSIAGKLIDETEQPIANAAVLLVTREYENGVLNNHIRSSAITDASGSYLLRRVVPGRRYWIYSKLSVPTIEGRTVVSRLAQQSRPDIWRSVWYPNSVTLDGSVPLIIKPGEHRESVNIKSKKEPAHCIDGAISAVPQGAQVLKLEIQDLQATSGLDANTALMEFPVAADHRFRICNVSPGDYRLLVHSDISDISKALLGATEISVSRGDVTDIVVSAIPPVSVPVQVAWDQSVDASNLVGHLLLSLRPLKTLVDFKDTLTWRSAIPNTTVMKLALNDYRLYTHIPEAKFYVKTATYNGVDVLTTPLRIAALPSSSVLELSIASGTGAFSALVTDRAGLPIADAQVVVLPIEADSAMTIASKMITGVTDQAGRWTAQQFRPGTYIVISPSSLLEMTPESLEALGSARPKGTRIEIESSKAVQVTVHPTYLTSNQ